MSDTCDHSKVYTFRENFGFQPVQSHRCMWCELDRLRAELKAAREAIAQWNGRDAPRGMPIHDERPQPLKFPRGASGDIDSDYMEQVITHFREYGGGPVAMIRATLLALESLTAQRHGEGQT